MIQKEVTTKTWIRDETRETEGEGEGCKQALQVFEFFFLFSHLFFSVEKKKMSSASPNFNDDGSPSCSSSCSSAFRLPPSPMQRGQGRRRHHASPSAPAFGDLATRLEGWDHPDDRVAPDGARLRATKYVRGWRPSRGDFKSERGPARPNVQVPFASEPSAIREFLWGKSFVLFLFNGRAASHSN